MPRRPSIEESLAERVLRLSGLALLALGAVDIAIALLLAVNGGTDWPRVLALILLGVLIALMAPTSLAVAEVLGRLRRQEERELVQQWEIEHGASERDAAAARELKRQALAQRGPSRP